MADGNRLRVLTALAGGELLKPLPQVMLMLVRICLRTKDWFPGGKAVPPTPRPVEQAPSDAMVP